MWASELANKWLQTSWLLMMMIMMNSHFHINFHFHFYLLPIRIGNCNPNPKRPSREPAFWRGASLWHSFPFRPRLSAAFQTNFFYSHFNFYSYSFRPTFSSLGRLCTRRSIHITKQHIMQHTSTSSTFSAFTWHLLFLPKTKAQIQLAIAISRANRNRQLMHFLYCVLLAADQSNCVRINQFVDGRKWFPVSLLPLLQALPLPQSAPCLSLHRV